MWFLSSDTQCVRTTKLLIVELACMDSLEPTVELLFIGGNVDARVSRTKVVRLVRCVRHRKPCLSTENRASTCLRILPPPSYAHFIPSAHNDRSTLLLRPASSPRKPHQFSRETFTIMFEVQPFFTSSPTTVYVGEIVASSLLGALHCSPWCGCYW